MNLRGAAYNHLRDCSKAGQGCDVSTLTFCDRGLDLLLKMLRREDSVRRARGAPEVFPMRAVDTSLGVDHKFGSV